MKKSTLYFLISVFFIFGSFASFACERPPSDAFLRKVLHEGRVPTKWRTVRGKSYKLNRGVDVLGVVAQTQEESYGLYKGKKYYLEDVTFCRTGENKFKGTHPKHGTVHVTRTGKGRKSMLSVRFGALRYNLRLNRYVTK